MTIRQIGIWGGLSFLAAASSASAARADEPDPCAFASSGALTFSYDQVLDCYRRVPFAPADLANIVQVVAQHRSFSDLGEIYDERVHWKQALAALDDPSIEDDYPNDMALHDAVKREHQRFRNGHVAYLPPACYWRMLNAIVPLNFGSTRWGAGRHAEQIVFVEGALAWLVELYRQATGIDLAALVGQRVVSINGVPVLDYFRAYSEDLKSHEDPGGGLNGVLNALTYSLRLNGPFDFVPDRPADEYVFESVGGERQTLQLPWVFIPGSVFLGDSAVPLTASTEEFVELCRLGPPEVPPADGAAALLGAARNLAPLAVDRERQLALQRLQASSTTVASSSSAAVASASPSGRQRDEPTAFYEVPAERLGEGIELIIPRTNNATVLQYDGHVTALQLLDTVGWVDVARQGVEYACEHSDRLIIDLRNNGGGNDTVIRWLHHYLFPERGQLVRGGMLPFRFRNDVPALNESLFNWARFMAQYAPALQVDPCWLVFTPGCLTDPRTGAPLVADDDWFADPSVRESRAGEKLSLSRFVGLPNIGNPAFDSASCAGRFQGGDLVFITDGSNASGGYFLPASFEGEGVIVTTGGYVGEPMAMGRARGGAAASGGGWAPVADAIEQLTEGAIHFEQELVGFTRPVGTLMEMLGFYRRNRRQLHIEHPVGADLHVEVWTDLPGSEGFVFQRVLDAVDAHAGKEPPPPPR